MMEMLQAAGHGVWQENFKFKKPNAVRAGMKQIESREPSRSTVATMHVGDDSSAREGSGVVSGKWSGSSSVCR